MTNTLYQQIQQFYDASSGLWEKIWGEHMHHGYYGRAGNLQINRRQAQIDLIEELLLWAGLSREKKALQNILDIGCGIGGSTLYLADKFNTAATGITLSPVQVSRATARAKEAGLSDRVNFQLVDALSMPFEPDSFDLVWSLESGEHMPDKNKFLQECYRILQPGGTLIMATWCHRPTDSLAGELTKNEREHLEKIYQVYCLPYVISLPEYEVIAKNCGFKDLRADDWSMAVAPFWDVVIDSTITPRAIIGLLESGLPTIKAALSLNLMKYGYERGLVRFGLITATK